MVRGGVPFSQSAEAPPSVGTTLVMIFADLASMAGGAFAIRLDSVSGVTPQPASADGTWYATDVVTALRGVTPPDSDIIQNGPGQFNLPKSFLIYPPKSCIAFYGTSGWAGSATFSATARGVLVPIWSASEAQSA